MQSLHDELVYSTEEASPENTTLPPVLALEEKPSSAQSPGQEIEKSFGQKVVEKPALFISSPAIVPNKGGDQVNPGSVNSNKRKLEETQHNVKTGGKGRTGKGKVYFGSRDGRETGAGFKNRNTYKSRQADRSALSKRVDLWSSHRSKSPPVPSARPRDCNKGFDCPNPFDCGYYHNDKEKKYVFEKINAANEKSKAYVEEQQRIEATKLAKVSFAIANAVSSSSSSYSPPVYNSYPGGNQGPRDKFDDSHVGHDGLRRPTPALTDVRKAIASSEDDEEHLAHCPAIHLGTSGPERPELGQKDNKKGRR